MFSCIMTIVVLNQRRDLADKTYHGKWVGNYDTQVFQTLVKVGENTPKGKIKMF